jgi:hypothetical protein
MIDAALCRFTVGGSGALRPPPRVAKKFGSREAAKA